MIVSSGCCENYDYTIIYEGKNYYIVKCNKCGEEFRVTK